MVSLVRKLVGMLIGCSIFATLVPFLLPYPRQSELSLTIKSSIDTSSSLKKFVCEPSVSTTNNKNGSMRMTTQTQNQSMAKLSTLRGYTPLPVMANPRVGSSLFFRFLEFLGDNSPPKEFAFQSKRELIGFTTTPDWSNYWQYSDTAVLLSDSCQLQKDQNGGNDPNDLTTTSRRPMLTWYDLKNGTVQEKLQLLQKKSQEYQVLHEWIEVYQNRYQDPMRCVDFLTRIPSPAKQAYMGFKLFRGHLKAIGMTPAEFIFQLHDRFGVTKFIVVWRRRLIESYVSKEIGMKTDKWGHRPSDANDAVMINRTDLEWYVRQTTAYYRSVHQVLSNLTAIDSEVEYEIVEYDRDLLRVEDQIRTVDRIQRFLNPLHHPINGMRLVEGNGLEKQARVPLRDQVLNWDEVVEWGYGGDLENWEDLFQHPPRARAWQAGAH